MSRPLVKIRDVCTIEKGGLNPQSHPDNLFAHYSIPAFDDGMSPVVELGASIKSQKTRISHGAVLVSKLNPRIPRVWVVNDEQPHRRICSTEFVPFQPNPTKLLPEFLAYALRRLLATGEITGTTSAATKSRERARPDAIADLRIPLPLIDEQRRIVDILSRAEGIVRLQREARKKAAEIIPALFLDMFGDPATNPKGWPTKSFGSVGTLDRGKSRHRPRDAKELYDGPYPFIQTGDVANSNGQIQSYSTTYSDIGLAQSRLWPAGTLCITIAANIARTGVLAFDSCFPDSVVGFLPGNQITTEYAQAWLGFLQPTLEATAPQAAQKNINLEILRGLPTMLPPVSLQEIFMNRCRDVYSIQSQQSAALQKAEAIFNALLDHVFSSNSAGHRDIHAA